MEKTDKGNNYRSPRPPGDALLTRSRLGGESPRLPLGDTERSSRWYWSRSAVKVSCLVENIFLQHASRGKKEGKRKNMKKT